MSIATPVKFRRRMVTGGTPAPHRGVRAARGFTLIEVLATVAVIAVVLPVAMQGISMSVKTASTARKTVEASILAQSKLDEMVAMPEASLTGGTVEDDGPYHVQTMVTPNIDPASMGLTLEELTVLVTWQDRQNQRQVKLATWVYRTTQ